jgi:hypothetical protein
LTTSRPEVVVDAFDEPVLETEPFHLGTVDVELPVAEIQEEWMQVAEDPLLKFQDEHGVVNAYEGFVVDPDHDWTVEAANFEIAGYSTFLTESKNSFVPPAVESVNLSALNPDQMKVFDAVSKHFHLSLPKEAFNALILGTAGTGKSFLIQALKSLLATSCFIVAPTGVAAANIGGHTIHSSFSIPVSNFRELSSDALFDLQKVFELVKYLIVDEISMVGQSLLGMVDSRLRQIFADKADVVFGGISVLMFGDFGQLPPVMDKGLYLPVVGKNVLGTQGRMAYQQVDRAFFLDTVIRQDGDLVFRDLLLRLRNGEVSSSDWKLLCTRDNVNAILLEPGFAESIFLFPTRSAVFQHNLSQLRRGEHTVAVMNAVHPLNDKASKVASSDDAGGLESQIALRLEAKVMLIQNLWVECGLVNGSVGFVKGFVYDVGRKPPQLPLVVLVHFPSYGGPTMAGNVVPIVPRTFYWKSKKRNCARTQLPLTLCWATTIHKSQGLTLPKAVIHLGNKEMSSGLSFVALSRVKRLQDLCLYPVNFDRLMSITKCTTLHIRRKEEQRLRSLAGY